MNFVDYMRPANFPKMTHAIRRLAFLKIGCAHAYGRWHFGRLFVILCLSAGPAVASGAEVSDLIINNSQGHLLLSLKIQDVTTKKTGQIATQEVSSTIVFSIALYQVHSFWFDKKIAHQTATNTLKYDPSKKEYSLMRSWNGGPPTAVAALDQAEKLMNEVKDLKVVPLTRLEKGRNYQVRVQAVCQDQNAFIFGPSGCFKTDWYTVDFTF